MSELMIQIENVSKWYGPVQVLSNCTVRIARGDVAVVCGPSGSGKSTLIKTVNGLEPVQQGRIVVDGTEVTSAATHLPKLRSRVGMVFQPTASRGPAGPEAPPEADIAGSGGGRGGK